MPKPSSLLAEIKFFHGWAYRADSWQSWKDLLKGGGNALEFYDRGYFGNRKEISPFQKGVHDKVVIAHSLGLHFISAEILSDAQWIVMIGSFKHFHEVGGGSLTRLATTRAMRNRLAKDAVKQLSDFYEQSGDFLLHSFEDKPNIGLLAEDLHLLDSHHYDLKSHPANASTLLLHGQEDLIADSLNASAFSNLLPASSFCIHPSANHALPFTHADWCLEQLARFCPDVFASDHLRAVSHAG